MTAPTRKTDSPIGVCARIGEDLGFNPDWLRVVLAAGLLWNAEIVLAVYAALGAIVLVSRLIFPARKASVTVVTLPVAPARGAEPVVAYAEAA